MAKVSEQISKANASSQGKTDSNLANDSLHLGGIPAGEYSTKEYVQKYHDGKEVLLKEYVDKQDQDILNQAKEYTNSQIRNQDFSEFAKVTDVQALDEKLTKNISEGLIEQKNYTDSKTKQIVDDTNANFQEVEGAIGKLNGTVNELFTSVSNGKSQVAEAITDKGVPTSANDTFGTMANNISKIQSGGGSSDPNYVNTSDATANAKDILLGKTAYAQGKKIIGELIAQTEPGGPTIGTDTSDATAYSNDIVYGKTAYARGQKLIGTLQNTEVEEIYGIDTGTCKVETINSIQTDPFTKDKITVERIAYAKDMSYVVRLVHLNDDVNTKYIESYAINDKGYYIQQSGNGSGDVVTKKYRYSMEELKIPAEETIMHIALGNRSLYGDEKKCRLLISTAKLSEIDTNAYVTTKVYTYTFHLSDNGIIGKAYENEYVEDNNFILDDIKCKNINDCKNVIATSNLDADRFVLIIAFSEGSTSTYYNKVYSCNINHSSILKETTEKKISSTDIDYEIDNYTFTENDEYITNLASGYVEFSCYSPVIKIDLQNNYRPEIIGSYINGFTSFKVNDTNLWIKSIHTRNLSTSFIEFYNSPALGGLPIKKLQPKELKSIYFAFATSKTVLTFREDGFLHIFNVDINTIENNSIVEANEKIFVGGYKIHAFLSNLSTIFVETDTHELRKVTFDKNLENIVALKYKNQYFYKMKPEELSAGTGDVKKGKTFIGVKGIPEEGTLEV